MSKITHTLRKLFSRVGSFPFLTIFVTILVTIIEIIISSHLYYRHFHPCSVVIIVISLSLSTASAKGRYTPHV